MCISHMMNIQFIKSTQIARLKIQQQYASLFELFDDLDRAAMYALV